MQRCEYTNFNLLSFQGGGKFAHRAMPLREVTQGPTHGRIIETLASFSLCIIAVIRHRICVQLQVPVGMSPGRSLHVSTPSEQVWIAVGWELTVIPAKLAAA